jgi:hypothetical protein
MLILCCEVEKSEGPSVSCITMPTSVDETTVAPLQEDKRKPNLTSQPRRDIVQALLLMVLFLVMLNIGVGSDKIRV